MKFILQLIVVGASFILADYLITGIKVDSFLTALIAALVLGLVNTIVRPILTFFTVPFIFLTLGLFIFVINALMYWATAFFIPGFEVNGFVAALLGALVTSVVSTIFSWMVRK